MEDKLIPLGKFRKEVIYQNSVNDLMQVNMNGLRKLYEELSKVKDFPHKHN